MAHFVRRHVAQGVEHDLFRFRAVGLDVATRAARRSRVNVASSIAWDSCSHKARQLAPRERGFNHARLELRG